MTPESRPLRLLVLATYPVEAACSRYRIVQFIQPLLRSGVNATFRPFLNSKTFRTLYNRRYLPLTLLRISIRLLRRIADVFRALRADVLFVQREALLFGPPIFEWLITKVLRVPMVLDLDDATYLPVTSPVYGSTALILKPAWKTDRLIDWSRVVICGNDEIARHVRERGTEAVVLPTIVDSRKFSPREHRNIEEKLVVGWIGSHSTFPYVEPLLPLLARLAKRYSFRVRIVGSGRDDVAVPGLDIDLRPWSLDREIDDFRSLDIGLYPLSDDRWAAGKSGLKAIQYMALGLPFVVTPVGICAKVGIPGVTHFEARREGDWEAALAKLLESAELRRKMGQAGREYAVDHFSLQRFADAIAKIVRAQRQEARNADEAVVAGFSDEWQRFDQSAMTDEEIRLAFDDYFAIFPWELLSPSAVGFDFGCGTGRWARLVAPRVGRLHCVDASPAALQIARRTLRSMKNCEFHLATAEEIPLADSSADFGYSLGVLHHIPDTRAALAQCVRKLKPGAPFLVYIYYSFENRPKWYTTLWRFTEPGRFLISRLPFALRYWMSQFIAATVYWPLARLAGVAERFRVPVSLFPLSYYRHMPFYAMRTDALDRFGTRLEQRFSKNELVSMMREAGLEDITFSSNPPFWCAVGIRAS